MGRGGITAIKHQFGNNLNFTASTTRRVGWGFSSHVSAHPYTPLHLWLLSSCFLPAPFPPCRQQQGFQGGLACPGTPGSCRTRWWHWVRDSWKKMLHPWHALGIELQSGVCTRALLYTCLALQKSPRHESCPRWPSSGMLPQVTFRFLLLFLMQVLSFIYCSSVLLLLKYGCLTLLDSCCCCKFSYKPKG